MTEKRFTETISTGIVTDHITGKEYNCEMRIDDELLESLNELADENDQLKYENGWLKSIHFANDVLKENKELKQSNERLLKMLDNVANYMQKQHKDMPIDEFVEWWNKMATEGLEND